MTDGLGTRKYMAGVDEMNPFRTDFNMPCRVKIMSALKAGPWTIIEKGVVLDNM